MSLRGRRHDGGGQNELIFSYTGNASATFDPTITTSTATTIVWQPDDAAPTHTTGTTHAFSYVPGAGSHRCKVAVQGGLGIVAGFDVQADAIFSIKNLSKCYGTFTGDFNCYNNTLLPIPLSEIPKKAITITIANTLAFGNLNQLGSIYTYLNAQSLAGITGSPSSISRICTSISLQNTSIAGDIAGFPNVAGSIVANSNAGLTGSLSSLGNLQRTIYLFGCINITAASIATLAAIRDLRIDSMGWNAAGVDTVLLSASDAVWANAAHFTYIAPALRIQTNAAPGGSTGADTTDPMTTPGSGNSNTDWEWDAGRGAHKALTGKAAIYFLTHNTGHAWIITYQAV